MYICINIWKSSFSRELKIQFFRAAVESALLFGAECWALTNNLTKRLDGVYTMYTAITYSIKEHLKNHQIYRNITDLTPKETDIQWALLEKRTRDDSTQDHKGINSSINPRDVPAIKLLKTLWLRHLHGFPFQTLSGYTVLSKATKALTKGYPYMSQNL